MKKYNLYLDHLTGKAKIETRDRSDNVKKNYAIKNDILKTIELTFKIREICENSM